MQAGEHGLNVADLAGCGPKDLGFRETGSQIVQPLFDAARYVSVFQAGLQGRRVVFDQYHDFPPSQFRHRLPLLAGANLPGQVRAGDQATPDHDILTAGDFPASPVVVNRPDLTVGDYVGAHCFTHPGNVFPIGGWLIAVDFASGMNHDFRSPGRFQSLGAGNAHRAVVVAKPHLCGHRRARWHCFANGGGDAVHQLRLPHQHATTLVLVHRFRRAAKVDINLISAQFDRSGAMEGHLRRIRTQ